VHLCKSRFSGSWQHGFSLIELLVVLSIGAMLIGLVPVAFSKLYDGSEYRDTVRSIVTELRHGRQIAVSNGQSTVFQLDLNLRTYGLMGHPMKSIPRSLEVRTTTGMAADHTSESTTEIVFLPEGGSTGGTIELLRRSGGGVRIRVDWLFGSVTQEPRAS
jgi:general secretion pathway protein H